TGKEDELASNLSHGEQRNLEIGIALATEPKLLCLDEPTAGMSVTETHATVDLIRRIARDLTILIVEHDMEVVMGLAHTITVLNYGEVLAEGRLTSKPIRGFRRSTSRPDADPRERRRPLWQVPRAARRVDRGARRRGRRPARAQRRGQDHDPQGDHGHGAPYRGPHHIRRAGS